MRTPHPQPPHGTNRPATNLPRLIALGLIAAALSVPVAAQAQTQTPTAPTQQNDCPTNWPTTPPASTELARQQLQQLQTLETACEDQSGFHAYKGLLLLQTGWLAEAATALEKSLLLAPEQPGVQLDYAQSLAQLGQKTSARELVQSVAARQDIQPDLRQWLATGLLPDTTSWAWASMVQNSLGHESNLTSASYSDSLTLYLPSGPVQVSLADSEKPQSGLGLKTSLAVQGLRPAGPGSLRVSASIQAKHAQNTHTSQLGEAIAAYAQPTPWGEASLQIGTTHFKQIRQYTYSDTSWRLKFEPLKDWNTCKTSPFGGQTRQRYRTDTNLSGQYTHTGLELQCTPSHQTRTIFSLSAGSDRPDEANRPGGVKRRQELNLRHERAWALPTPSGPAVQGLFKIWLRQHHTQDQALFSPLLGNSNIRTRRQDLGLAYWWGLAPGWSMGVDLENTSQKSTNTLLNIKNLTAYVNIRWASKP